MARRLRPVELDFSDTAPVRLSFTAQLTAGPEAVYVALAEDVENWPRWFTAVTSATPTGGGRGRDMRLKGGGFFSETIMAAHAPQRYAYRMDTTNAPGMRAMLEDWRLTPTASGGTGVRWTMAADGTAALRLAMRLARPAVGRAFRDAMRNLDHRLAPARAPSRGAE
ncbi:SRPBCC family protein [Streptomyces daliensis]|uniref:SRPBCC family protein n=1 Tax=Streptomyces daliensis TaxID=299421 RepID=A0A8T4IMY5_9ACTN|nr:SRPBCC family protein [Streptomyces daliensis]